MHFVFHVIKSLFSVSRRRQCCNPFADQERLRISSAYIRQHILWLFGKVDYNWRGASVLITKLLFQ